MNAPNSAEDRYRETNRTSSGYPLTDAEVLALAVADLFDFIVSELDPDPCDSVTDYLNWPQARRDALLAAMRRGMSHSGGPSDG